MTDHPEAGEPDICKHPEPEPEPQQPQSLLILITESTDTNKTPSSCSKVAWQWAQVVNTHGSQCTHCCPRSMDCGPNHTQCWGKFRSLPHPPLHFLLLFLCTGRGGCFKRQQMLSHSNLHSGVSKGTGMAVVFFQWEGGSPIRY